MADKKSELREIARDGGKAQKNSGRGNYQKGDAVLEPFLYDIKEYANSFGLSLTVWAKICTDAFRSGQRIPALKIVLGEKNKVRLWVVEEDMFNQMLEAWKEKYEQ